VPGQVDATPGGAQPAAREAAPIPLPPVPPLLGTRAQVSFVEVTPMMFEAVRSFSDGMAAVLQGGYRRHTRTARTAG